MASKAGFLMVARFIDFMLRKKVSEKTCFAVEVPFILQKRRADLLVVSDTLTAYEFKSDRDKLDNLANQLQDYNKCFHQVYVVIPPKHLKKSRLIIKKQVGIIVDKDGKFLNIRKAKQKKRMDKMSLINSMPVSFLRIFFSEPKHLSAYDFRKRVFDIASSGEIIELWRNWLKNSYSKNHAAFLKERGMYTHTEDLRRISTIHNLSIND